jgi:tyrosyl-tRNA synthetase
MSQSLGNYIGVEDEPAEMFGKTMSIPDTAMPEWFRLAADYDSLDVDEIEAGLASAELHPNDVKRQLARSVVSLYWGGQAGVEAEQGFDEVFKRGGAPDEMVEHQLPPDDPINVPSLIREVFGISGAEARRLLTQGAVRVDGETSALVEMPRSGLVGTVIKVGKRRFARLTD